MPRTKDHEKNRLKKARLKKLSRFPKNAKLKRPSDPEQAKEWLREVADHLSNHLNAGPCFRFVAYAIKKYLRHPKTLDLASELNLIYSPGRPRTFKERTEEQRRARRTHKLKTGWQKHEPDFQNLEILIGRWYEPMRNISPILKKRKHNPM